MENCFRITAFLILNKLDISISQINNKNDGELIKNIKRHIQKLQKLMNNVDVKNDNVIYDNNIINNDTLYSREVNNILPLIANDKMIRSVVIEHMNKLLSKKNNYVLTGHNLDDINTTNFITIFLEVDDEIAAQRLMIREKDNYKSISNAINHIIYRNNSDKIQDTLKELPYLYNAFKINTSNLNADEVFYTAIEEIEKIREKQISFDELQKSAIPRTDFSWITNPFFDILKNYIDNFLNSDELPCCISETDLEYQVLIKLALYRIEDLFLSKNNLKILEQKVIKNRDPNVFNQLKFMINNNELVINTQLVDREIYSQTEKMLKMYQENNIITQMEWINNINSNSKYSLKDVVFKTLDSETSEFIARYCHYLHTPRKDEYVAFAAFLPEVDFPVAWVSYSRQDREYKKQLLYEMGIEPNRTLEMTRAWCSNYAPKNIMSSLFQYSFNEIKNNWITKKEFQGVSTTINPNLSFKASSFLGSNFIPCALRPAKYTYQKINDEYQYSTRRNLRNNEYIENQMQVLPLNEMFMCIDTRFREKLRKFDIYQIDKKIYENVTKGKIYE